MRTPRENQKNRYFRQKLLDKLSIKKWYKEPMSWIVVALSLITMFQTYYISKQNQRIQGFDSLLRYTNQTLQELTFTNKTLDSNIKTQTLEVFKKIYDESKSSNRPFLKVDLSANPYDSIIEFNCHIENTGKRAAGNLLIKGVLTDSKGQKETFTLGKQNILSPRDDKYFDKNVKFNRGVYSTNIKINITVMFIDNYDNKQYLQSYNFSGFINGGTINFNNEKPRI